MFTSHRAVLVAGVACLVGGAWTIGAGSSVLLATLLLLGARAFAEPEARGWIAASAPIWAGAVVVAVWRAGSSDLGDIGGAHHVLGVGLVRGPTLAVLSLWLVALACVAVAGAPRPPLARLAWLVQAVLVVALVVAPQITDVGDALVWMSALVAVGAQIGMHLFAGPAQRLLVARTAITLAIIAGAIA